MAIAADRVRRSMNQSRRKTPRIRTGCLTHKEHVCVCPKGGRQYMEAESMLCLGAAISLGKSDEALSLAMPEDRRPLPSIE
jgi:hypothetical protein